MEDFLTIDWILSAFDEKINRAQKAYREFILQDLEEFVCMEINVKIQDLTPFCVNLTVKAKKCI